MSGLSTDKKGGNNIYLSVMNGKLVQNVNAETPGAVARQNKNNETVHELLFTGLTAKITNIALVDAKFGKELEIKANAGGQNFVIQTGASGGYAFGFFTRMPNLDFDKETEIRPYAIEDKAKGKTNHVIVLYQDGKKIESAFTKDAPNGLPELTTIKDGNGNEILKAGKPIWDDSARIEFFESIIYGEGGINDVLIKKYGSAEAKAENESPENFLEETNAPELEADGGKSFTEQIEEEHAQQINAANADAVASNEVKTATKKKAAAKK